MSSKGSKKKNKSITMKGIRRGRTHFDWTPSNRLHSTIKRMLKAS